VGKRTVYYITIFALFLIALSIPVLVHSPYLIDIFITLFTEAMLAMAFLLVLSTGLVNMGVFAFSGIGAYASAILVTKLGVSFWLSWPLSCFIAGIFGLVVGLVILRGVIGGFAFVVLSAVIGMLFPLIIGSIRYVGGTAGMSHIPPPEPIRLPSVPDIVFDSNAHFYYLALFLLVVVVVVLCLFYRSWVGTAWRAIGLSPRLADAVGINVFRYRIVAFVLSCVICGAVGCFSAHYTGFLSPSSFGMWRNVDVQVYAVLGGVGFAVAGPLVGSALITLLSELMVSFAKYEPVITGAILIALILFLPNGLLGLTKRGGRWQWRPYTLLGKEILARVSSVKGGRNKDAS
jgi:branched-chain amino acid transport system permease protein